MAVDLNTWPLSASHKPTWQEAMRGVAMNEHVCGIDCDGSEDVGRRYSCMYCNTWFCIYDPEFEYFRTYGENHWHVREGIAKVGDPMDGQNGRQRDTLGWFAKCRDRDECKNVRQPLNHLGFEQRYGDG